MSLVNQDNNNSDSDNDIISDTNNDTKSDTKSDTSLIIKSQPAIVKFSKKMKWNDENENILKNWADKGICFKTMHDRSTKKYWCLNAWFSIPVIIISTLAGSGNFAQSSFNPAYADLMVLGIASANIFCAMLSTISQYIGVAGLVEAHKFSALSWDKYSRSLQVELAKNRSERKDATTFIGKAEEDFNRLMEIAPVFGNDIISWFNHLIDTGDYDESTKYICGPCCYQWFNFPCGCKGCMKPRCESTSGGCGSKCSTPDKDEDEIDRIDDLNELRRNNKNEKELIDMYMKNKDYKQAWTHLELPDILGRMRPTCVADPNNDPGRIVEAHKNIQGQEIQTSVENITPPPDPSLKYRVLADNNV